MMPFCSWNRCRNVSDHKIDVHVEGEHSYLCHKHYFKLLRKLGIRGVAEWR